MTAAERRKNYLVEKKFQLKPVYLIAGAFLFITVIIEWQIFSLLTTVLPQITLMETRNNIIWFGVSIMVQLFIILLVLAILIIIYLHRLVGPVKRLQRELKEMNETGKYHQLEMRKKDELKSFISEVNNLIAKMMK